MNNKVVTITIGLVVVLGIGAFVYSQNTSKQPTDNGNTGPTEAQTQASNNENMVPHDDDDDDSIGVPTPQSQPVQSAGYTMADVATHNSRTSCWSALNGNVYDLTSFIQNHPGGEKRILDICGVDGSAAFNAKHGESNKVASVLVGFKIGTLSQ